MTDEQYKKYTEIKKEIEPLEWLMGACKNEDGYYLLRSKLILSSKRFSIGRKRNYENPDILEISQDLQDRIIAVIEQYVNEKRKEISEI